MKEEIEYLKDALKKLQQKYDTMLTVRADQALIVNNNISDQMYGEKVEEAEELRLDLQDVKEMYKMQIDQLTNSSSWERLHPPSTGTAEYLILTWPDLAAHICDIIQNW